MPQRLKIDSRDIPARSLPQAQSWLGYKLCGPLGEWRPDVPDLWPVCACGTAIKTGDYYGIRYPITMACLACSGLIKPNPEKRVAYRGKGA